MCFVWVVVACRNRLLEPYTYTYVVEKSVKTHGPWAKAPIIETSTSARFELQTSVYSGGVTRLRLVEPSVKRHEVEGILTEEHQSRHRRWESVQRDAHGGRTRLVAGDVEVVVDDAPFAVHMFQNGKEFGALNARGLLALEHTRTRGKEENDTDHMWSETFGGATDSKPNGPQALSIDASFPLASHLYGLPDRLQKFSLPRTIDSDGNPTMEPYRLYNLDIPHFESDSNYALYGSVPFAFAHSPSRGSSGLFFLNSAEMYVDHSTHAESGVDLHWLAESGIADLFFLPGPSPKDVSSQYAMLTGSTDLPQEFALGFHQCRWNYRDQEDLLNVNSNFDHFDMPADVLWLDIEHTDKKKYLTWDTRLFPDPKAMQIELKRTKRKLVTIVDPHVKREDGYWIHSEASSKGYYVKAADGKSEYKGQCWPGEVSYLDVTRTDVREWFQSQLSPSKYNGSDPEVLFIWNDMNEPSVFTGPEVTMPKDLQHAGGWEHRDVHNVYGHLYAMGTAEGLRKRVPGERPFVLTRAHFAGTQRHAAVWTGDNTADWPYLRYSVSQLLRLNVAGIAFSGADVGGFFSTPGDELVTRWFQLGIYNPFFRSHAHHETARQEPWLFEEPTRSRLKMALRERYTLIPYLYTLFAENSKRGTPVLRPLWFEFPNDAANLDRDDHFMLGDALMVRPVMEEGASAVDVHLPGDNSEVWYDALGGEVHRGSSEESVEVTLDDIPTFQRGGTIVTRRERPRRSTLSQHGDPYSLYIALDQNGESSGTLYLDDGHTYSYRRNEKFLWQDFHFSNATLYAQVKGAYQTEDRIERIVLLGPEELLNRWKAAIARSEGNAVDFQAEIESSTVRPTSARSRGHAVLIRTQCLRVGKSWSLTLQRQSPDATLPQCKEKRRPWQMTAAVLSADRCEEPGTSECPNARVQCSNVGYFSTEISISMAEDGICDCCDGSDEEPHKCPNTCASLASQRKEELQNKLHTLSRGLEIRRIYASSKAVDQEQKRREAEGLMKDIEIQKEEVGRLEQQKREAEAEEERERKMFERKRAYEEQQEDDEFVDAPAEPDEENPLKGSDAADLDEYEVSDYDDEPVASQNDYGNSDDELIEGSDVSDNEVETDAFDESEAEYEYVHDDDYDVLEEDLASTLTPEEQEEFAKRYTKPAEWDDDEDGEWHPPNATAEADEAREAERNAKNKLSELEKQKTDAEQIAQRDYGADSALAHLDGVCLEFKSEEYTYKVCPYGDAHQSNIRLGTFEALENGEKQMRFTNGQPCGGGPKRQLTLKFECGETDELLSMEEPEMCSYFAVARTPAGCFQAEYERTEAELDALTQAENQSAGVSKASSMGSTADEL